MLALAEPPADAELGAALACDLDAAFEALVIAYRQRIVNFIARAIGDGGRAEDVAQDVFVRAYRALQTYPAERRAALRLRSWLYAIAHNLSRNALRDAAPFADSLDLPGRDNVADGAEGPEARAVRAEAWERVARAVAQLSPRLRPAYVLRYLDDLPYDEIAQILDQPAGTVRASAHRAASAVRTYLEHDS